jgi:cytochrome c-type biogenesis protein
MDITFFSIATSFIAGVLSVLAPCALPLLPVILQGSQQGKKSLVKSFIIIISLAISFIVFTIILKHSVGFLGLNEKIIKILSGLILVFVSITYIFPDLWSVINTSLGLSSKSDKAMEKAAKKEGILSYILTGVALGPVFTTCSPTYGVIVSQVLQSSISSAILLTTIFATGLSLVLMVITIFGRSLTKRISFMANPSGAFRKIVGWILCIFGIMIITGLDKTLESLLVDFFGNTFNWYGTTSLENDLLKQFRK